MKEKKLVDKLLIFLRMVENIFKVKITSRMAAIVGLGLSVGKGRTIAEVPSFGIPTLPGEPTERVERESTTCCRGVVTPIP